MPDHAVLAHSPSLMPYKFLQDTGQIVNCRNTRVCSSEMSESREELLANAVKFLQDPSVQSTPISSRVSFLERKGLNQNEIDNALTQAGLSITSRSGDKVHTGHIQQMTGPALPASGPSKALTSLATSEGFSWSRLMLYIALTSGAMAALRNSTLTTWLVYIYKRSKHLLLTLFFGEEAAVNSPTTPTSLDGLSEVRQQLADLKTSFKQLQDKLDHDVLAEVQQVRETVKYTYGKLEDDLDELRSTVHKN